MDRKSEPAALPGRPTLNLLLALLALLGATAAVAATTPTWPARTVRVVSPYGPGGSNDTAARIIAEQLSRRLGQPFIVENKPGAGTRLANEQVARAAPDGHTLLFAAAPFAIGQALYKKVDYDIRKDFAPVALAVLGPVFLVVNADTPVRNVREFVAMAREKKGGVTFASPGAGSGPHLTAELFAGAAKFEALNVHYRGDATAYVELLAGRTDATLTAILTALPQVKAGKLRVLAVASEERTAVYPDVPTFKEQGYPDVVGYGWFGFVAPAGTPAAVIERLNAEVNAILQDADARKRLIDAGLQPRGGSAQDFARFVEHEVDKWSAVVRQANLPKE